MWVGACMAFYEKKYLGISFLFLFVLLFLSFSPMVFADISKCANKTGFEKDDCIVANAKSASECTGIFSPTSREQCILRLATKPSDCELITDEAAAWGCVRGLFPPLESLKDCSKFPSKYLAKCEAFVTFQNNPEDISACWSLKYASQKECVEEYVTEKKISDPNFCLGVKDDFQVRCAYLATLNKYGLSSVLGKAEKSACEKYTGKIKEGCEQYFSFSGIAKGVMGSFFIGGAIFLLLGIIFVVGLIAVIIFVLTRKPNKPKPEKQK